MRVGMVANTTNDKTWKVIHQTCCLHLEAKDASKLGTQPVSGDPILHDLIARSCCAVMNDWNFILPRGPYDCHIFAALIACRSSDVIIRGAEENIWTYVAAIKL